MSQILVELQEHMGSDRSIANAAWTSSLDKSKRDTKTDEQVADLVRRLIKDQHGTPIESVIFRFWIRMPIFTDRQHMTHRIASHNGLSGRYRTMPEDWFKIPQDVIDIFNKVDSRLVDLYEQSCDTANRNYRYTVNILKGASDKAVNIITNEEFKRAREIARAQLPTAGMVERTTIMNLRSFANYMHLRLSDHAQPEIRTVARLMLEEVEKANICPVAIEELKKLNWKF